VQQVNWYDAVLFCNWLSRREGLIPCYERTGEKEKNGRGFLTRSDAWQLIPEANGYRLPTEAEWEYACRAGTVTAFSFGNDESKLDDHAWYRANVSKIQPVGGKKPNAWGLHDVHGGVWEWIQDWYGNDYYKNSPSSDPIGPTDGIDRVVRGGGSGFDPVDCRSMSRSSYPLVVRINFIGLRVALSIAHY